MDVTFDPGSGADDIVRVVALQTGGGVLIGGEFRTVNDRTRRGIARLIGGDPPPSVPVVRSQPLRQTVIEGADVSFSVQARGFPLPSFQWMRNGQPIVGATSPVVNLVNVDLSQAGDYSVAVSNTLGSVTSSNATLVVLPAPTQPGLLDLSFRASNALSNWPDYRFVKQRLSNPMAKSWSPAGFSKSTAHPVPLSRG